MTVIFEVGETMTAAMMSSKNLEERLEELLLVDADDNDDKEMTVWEVFHEFLMSNKQGPRLDEDTVIIMAKSGVTDRKSFLA